MIAVPSIHDQLQKCQRFACHSGFLLHLTDQRIYGCLTWFNVAARQVVFQFASVILFFKYKSTTISDDYGTRDQFSSLNRSHRSSSQIS